MPASASSAWRRAASACWIAALAAGGGRLGRRSLLQFLDALSEPDEAEIVKRGRLEALILAGEGAFQGGLRFAQFARAKLPRAGIVELARSGGRRRLGAGADGRGGAGRTSANGEAGVRSQSKA